MHRVKGFLKNFVLSEKSSSKPSLYDSDSYAENEEERILRPTWYKLLQGKCLPDIIGLIHICNLRDCANMQKYCTAANQKIFCPENGK